jgi:hypothetical protein
MYSLNIQLMHLLPEQPKLINPGHQSNELQIVGR